MIRSTNSVLPIWQIDSTPLATHIEGYHQEKTQKPIFCAGGDVKAVALDGKNGSHNVEDVGYGRRGHLKADLIFFEKSMN